MEKRFTHALLCVGPQSLAGVWYAPDEDVVNAANAALDAMAEAGAVIVDNVDIAFPLSAYLNEYNANTSACGASWNRYGITSNE